MTREDIEKAVMVWQSRLNLAHWLIKVDWSTVPADRDSGAHISITENRDRATIMFEHDVLSRTPKVVNNYIAHELMHIHSHHLYDVVYNMMDRENGEVRLLLSFIYGEIERMNDRIATAFSDYADNTLE